VNRQQIPDFFAHSLYLVAVSFFLNSKAQAEIFFFDGFCFVQNGQAREFVPTMLSEIQNPYTSRKIASSEESKTSVKIEIIILLCVPCKRHPLALAR